MAKKTDDERREMVDHMTLEIVTAIVHCHETDIGTIAWALTEVLAGCLDQCDGSFKVYLRKTIIESLMKDASQSEKVDLEPFINHEGRMN